MLPSLMLTLALLVQPAIFFTRVVMRSAAAEGHVQVVATGL